MGCTLYFGFTDPVLHMGYWASVVKIVTVVKPVEVVQIIFRSNW
jgi:hypothetical protein